MQKTIIVQLTIYILWQKSGTQLYNILVNLIEMLKEGINLITNSHISFPVLSWPHFLNAEEKYQKAVEGLNPDPESHGSWFDIQQVTGATLSAKVTSSKLPWSKILTDRLTHWQE